MASQHAMVHFYDVGGVLVRRWVPMQRRLTMEAWTGDGWMPYPDADRVVRYGELLSEERALALLADIRSGVDSLAPLSDDEARKALVNRLRRS